MYINWLSNHNFFGRLLFFTQACVLFETFDFFFTFIVINWAWTTSIVLQNISFTFSFKSKSRSVKIFTKTSLSSDVSLLPCWLCQKVNEAFWVLCCATMQNSLVSGFLNDTQVLWNNHGEKPWTTAKAKATLDRGRIYTSSVSEAHISGRYIRPWHSKG